LGWKWYNRENGGIMRIIIILFCLWLIGCCATEHRISYQAKKTTPKADRIYMNQQELDTSITIFSEAIKKNPNYAGAYYNRAVAYFYKKDYDKSWADVHTAERLGIEVNQRFLKLVDKLKKASGRER